MASALGSVAFLYVYGLLALLLFLIFENRALGVWSTVGRVGLYVTSIAALFIGVARPSKALTAAGILSAALALFLIWMYVGAASAGVVLRVGGAAAIVLWAVRSRPRTPLGLPVAALLLGLAIHRSAAAPHLTLTWVIALGCAAFLVGASGWRRRTSWSVGVAAWSAAAFLLPAGAPPLFAWAGVGSLLVLVAALLEPRLVEEETGEGVFE